MPDFKAMIKDFDEKEAQRPAEAQKGKENPNKSELAENRVKIKQAKQPKQGTFKQAINDIRKADEGTKVPPHGFEIGPDGTYVPKEYSDSDMREAYDAAMEHIKKGGNAMEFRDQHPEYNADAIMAAFDDYSKSPNKENGEVDVPYHEGTKGKIVGRKDGVVTVEYTGKNGITRRDQFSEDEFKSNKNESLETIDNRGEGANPNFNREKFGKYFNPDGTLKKGMENEYFAATRGKDDSGANGNGNAPENDYGGLGEEHNRLYEEFMAIDKEYRDADAKLDEQVRQGQIGTGQWDKFWDEKDKLYDHYTDLKRKKKAEMDAVYSKIKAIDDERERKIREANKKKEEDALTAKRNQVRAELERRNGRKYSDEEWATIVELASQIR